MSQSFETHPVMSLLFTEPFQGATGYVDRPPCQAVRFYHNCGCKSKDKIYLCEDPYCNHYVTYLCVGGLPFACQNENGPTELCQVEDPARKSFVREVDTGTYLDHFITRPGCPCEMIDEILPDFLFPKGLLSLSKVKGHNDRARCADEASILTCSDDHIHGGGGVSIKKPVVTKDPQTVSVPKPVREPEPIEEPELVQEPEAVKDTEFIEETGLSENYKKETPEQDKCQPSDIAPQESDAESVENEGDSDTSESGSDDDINNANDVAETPEKDDEEEEFDDFVEPEPAPPPTLSIAVKPRPDSQIGNIFEDAIRDGAKTPIDRVFSVDHHDKEVDIVDVKRKIDTIPPVSELRSPSQAKVSRYANVDLKVPKPVYVSGRGRDSPLYTQYTQLGSGLVDTLGLSDDGLDEFNQEYIDDLIDAQMAFKERWTEESKAKGKGVVGRFLSYFKG
ncbi:hypothetical protein Hte_001416 [Hypoxylon texense]